MKGLLSRLRQYANTYRELIVYIITGGITTLVNFAVFWLCKDLFGIHYAAANVLAWLAAVIAAFVMNKWIVFRDAQTDVRTVIVQFLGFAGLRVASGALETGLLVVFVEYLHFSEDIVKLVVAVLVVILNYIFSKLLIFRKKKEEQTE